MPKKQRAIGSDLVRLDATTDEEIARQIAEDPDTGPELTDEMLEEAEIYEGDRFIRQVGRPKGSGKKELITLRLDRDLLEHFRARGPGWQTRLNDTLRAAMQEPAMRKAALDAAAKKAVELLEEARNEVKKFRRELAKPRTYERVS